MDAEPRLKPIKFMQRVILKDGTVREYQIITSRVCSLKMHHPDADEVRQIVGKIDSGMTKKDVGKEHNLSLARINTIIRKYNINPDFTSRPVIKKERILVNEYKTMR